MFCVSRRLFMSVWFVLAWRTALQQDTALQRYQSFHSCHSPVDFLWTLDKMIHRMAYFMWALEGDSHRVHAVKIISRLGFKINNWWLLEPIRTWPCNWSFILTGIRFSGSTQGKSPQSFFEVSPSVGGNVAWHPAKAHRQRDWITPAQCPCCGIHPVCHNRKEICAVTHIDMHINKHTHTWLLDRPPQLSTCEALSQK